MGSAYGTLAREQAHGQGPPAQDADVEGSRYRISTPIVPPRRTNSELALEIADFWRLRCVALMEENLTLKKQVLDAVAETLRMKVVVREDDL